MIRVQYIKKDKLQDLNEEIKDELEANIMPWNDIQEMDNLNDNIGIVALFFKEDDLVSLLLLHKYNDKQTKEFKLPKNTYEIMDVYVFAQFRNQGLCRKMIETIIDDFESVSLKVTYEPSNIAAYKCYKDYFQSYKNEKNIKFLKKLWNSNDEYESMIRY